MRPLVATAPVPACPVCSSNRRQPFAYGYDYEIEQNIPTISLKGKEFLDRLKLNGILSAIGKSPGSFLDIGCGNGRYMDFFANRGMAKKSIYGLELSEVT